MYTSQKTALNLDEKFKFSNFDNCYPLVKFSKKKKTMKDGGSPLKALNTIHSTPKKHQNLCDVFIFTPCNILNL